MRAKRRIYSASRVRCTRMCHHRANRFRDWKDYLRVEKDYLGLEKTIYGLKKTIYGFGPSFFRIVSLLLITWRTFNQINEQEYMNAVYNKN